MISLSSFSIRSPVDLSRFYAAVVSLMEAFLPPSRFFFECLPVVEPALTVEKAPLMIMFVLRLDSFDGPTLNVV